MLRYPGISADSLNKGAHVWVKKRTANRLFLYIGSEHNSVKKNLKIYIYFYLYLYNFLLIKSE